MAVRFREIIRPGTNYEFVGKSRTIFTISVLLVLLSIAMLPINYYTRGSMLNWTIDFKGGTEIITSFDQPVDVASIRSALAGAGHANADVSSFTFAAEGETRQGYLLRLPAFGAVDPEHGARVADVFLERFADREPISANWSGDVFFVRMNRTIPQEEFRGFLAEQNLDMRPWTPAQEAAFATPLAGTTEHTYEVGVFGLERQVEQALAAALGVQVTIQQVDMVGPKAGEELRNDGIKALLFAIALMLLYIAFRFDFRYGPGTVAALLHDAILVVGVFAVTWTEFSLTTVAAVLTVIGYSMNDTIVVFDRIRENERKLKDKKFDRVINISINETLSRSILTSGTTFMVTLALNLLGTGLVKNFAFALNVGIVVGTLSSIFIASPILLWLDTRYFSKRATRPKKPAAAEGV
jgi:preprotein translocase subunit SecF